MGYIGMCRCEGYGFQAVYSRIGCINQSVWVQNRVSFFRKLISWLKILSRQGKQLLQDRGIWGIYSSIGQQNSAELALVQVKGSRVPAAHPHPEIPKENTIFLADHNIFRIEIDLGTLLYVVNMLSYMATTVIPWVQLRQKLKYKVLKI